MFRMNIRNDSHLVSHIALKDKGGKPVFVLFILTWFLKLVCFLNFNNKKTKNTLLQLEWPPL